MIDETTRESLRTKTVEVILDLRALHLSGGASPLKHWDVLMNRVKSAARRSETPEQWVTKLAHGLQIQAPSNSASSSIMALVNLVTETRCAAEWLALVESEGAYLLALTRKIAEERRSARENAQ